MCERFLVVEDFESKLVLYHQELLLTHERCYELCMVMIEIDER